MAVGAGQAASGNSLRPERAIASEPIVLAEQNREELTPYFCYCNRSIENMTSKYCGQQVERPTYGHSHSVNSTIAASDSSA